MFTVQIKQLGYLEQVEYTFPENKLCRLYAPSGQGKSTFCRAIYWALYGKETNILPLKLRDGTNLSEVPKVNLIYYRQATETDPGSYLALSRNNNPHRLIVYTHPQGTPLTGVEAQEHINKVWGPMQYASGMYLEQGIPCTFLTLTDKQKLDFLLHLQYRNSTVQALQAKIEVALKETRDQLRVNRTIVERDERTLTALTTGVDYNQCATIEQIHQWRARVQELQARIPLLEQTLTAIGSSAARAAERSRLNQRREELTAQLCSAEEWNRLTQGIKSTPWPSETSLPSAELTREQIKLYQTELEQWTKLAHIAGLNLTPDLPRQLEYLFNQRQAQEAARKEYAELQALIRPSIHITDYRQRWEKYQSNLTTVHRLSRLPSLSEFNQTYSRAQEQERKLKLDLQSLECPHCARTVHLENGILVPANQIDKHKVETNLKSLQQWIKNADAQRDNINLRERLERELTAESDLRNCTTEQLIELENKFSRVQSSLSTPIATNWDWPVSYNPHALQYTADQLRRYEQEHDAYTLYQQFVTSYGLSPNNLRQRYEAQQKLRTQLNEITVQLTQCAQLSVDDLDPTQTQMELTNSRNEQQQLWQQIEISERANQLRARHEEVEVQRHKVVQLEQAEQNWLSIQAKFTTLLNQRLENIVEVFNQKLTPFLELCFSGRQIEARMQLTKTMRNKTIRYKINMILRLDGHEYTKYTFLSGGEQSRLSLAMTLAFAHLIPHPLLIIDEILGPLDPERTVEVLSRLHEFIPPHKICIIADHHSPASLFDHDYEFNFKTT